MMFSKGLRHMFLAGLFFSFMNLGVKFLSHLPTMQVVFFRALLMFFICLWYLKKNNIHPLGNNRKILFLRGFFGVIALSCYFYSLQNLPFASAVTIMQLSPIFTTLLAIFILKERIKPIQLIFFFISFLGVVLIKGFDTRISLSLLIIALAGSIISALAYNMIRKVKDTDHPMVVVFYFPLVALPISGVATMFQFVWPSWTDILLLVAIGLCTQFAQINMTRALQMEKIAKVSIVRYLTIVYAIIYGFLFFQKEQDQYNFYTYIGILLVVVGIVINILYSNFYEKNNRVGQ